MKFSMLNFLQEVIRRLLLLSVDDSNRKICTAISMAVSSVAHYDWPEDWPDLLPFLLKLINDQTNINGGKSLAVYASAEPPLPCPFGYPIYNSFLSYISTAGSWSINKIVEVLQAYLI